MATLRVALFLSVVLCSSAWAEPVLLISIDGLHPSYVLEADRYDLKIPALRRFVRDGAHARGVIGVIPTVTYPNHTTLVTGAAPAAHGILSNTPFDPLQTNREGWYWYAEDVKAPTLWHAAKRSGLKTAAVNWPVTVGERNVDFLLPEFWRASTGDDLKLLRQLDRPENLLEQLEPKLGPFIDGYVDTLESDRVRTRFAAEILREFRPQFMAVHLIALDGVQHQLGPWGAHAFDTLEALDEMIEDLTKVALANDPQAVVVVASDHGFIATHTAVNLRVRFVEAGLIRLQQTASSAQPIVEAWDAQVWSGAASAAVVLRDRKDEETRQRVRRLLDAVLEEPRNGVARVLGEEELAAAGAFSGADFLVEFAPGFYLGSALTGPLLSPATSKGTHGYLPSRPEMYASFFVMGGKTAAGRDLGIIEMQRIAPTLAAVLGVELPGTAEPAPIWAAR